MKKEDYVVDLENTTREELLNVISNIVKELGIKFATKKEDFGPKDILIKKSLYECEREYLEHIYETVVMLAKMVFDK